MAWYSRLRGPSVFCFYDALRLFLLTNFTRLKVSLLPPLLRATLCIAFPVPTYFVVSFFVRLLFLGSLYL